MKYVKNNGSVDLTNIVVRGGLPTMPVGKYTGIYVGRTVDNDGLQWLTVSTTKLSHVEQSDIEVPNLQPGQQINFEIEARNGAIACMQGNQYKLQNIDRSDITDWMDVSDLYRYIKDNEIVLAEPKLSKLEKLDE
jgi:hypothetical protein